MADTLTNVVVDDTKVYCRILSLIVAKSDNVELIGKSPNGKIALKTNNILRSL